MVRLTGLVAQATLLLLALYNAVTALWGWPDRVPAGPGSGRRRLRVVIPAHDEASVIGALLDDLAEADYPEDLHRVWVLADRCRDETAEVGRVRGAAVAERTEGTGGKGAALSWYLDAHPLADEETLVVFDADNRVPPNVLRRIADEIDRGHQVVQCYLDVTDHGPQSLLAEASALSYWAGNRMVQLARSNLGWSADLGGTGMALTKRAIFDAGGFTASLTEDQDLGIRLALAGYRVEWLHDVKVEDEKPRSLRVAVMQRARWMAGKRAARRRHLKRLLSERPSMSRLDLAIRLVQPGRSFVALVSGLLAVMAATTRSDWLLPWQVWGTATAVQALEPIPFLAREGVPARQLARYPLLALLAALWVPIRLVSTRAEGWYHTPHHGATPGHEEETVP
jgi:cellulose synthase/poly-beta-1,6-N-acetylglucosamine synthase-like glycosyltransferase